MTLEPHTLTHDDTDERADGEPVAPLPPEPFADRTDEPSATESYRSEVDEVERADDGDVVDGTVQDPVVAEPVATGSTPAAGGDADPVRLIEDPDGFRQRWQALQVDFVDDPAGTVSGAAELVGTVVERFVAALGDQRDELESSWSTGDEDTERLRQALRRYRGLFERLLDV